MNKRKDDLAGSQIDATGSEFLSNVGLNPTVIFIGKRPMAGCTFRLQDKVISVELPFGSFTNKYTATLANLFRKLTSDLLGIGESEIELRASIEGQEAGQEVQASYVLILPARFQAQVKSLEFQKEFEDVVLRIGKNPSDEVTNAAPVEPRSDDEERVEKNKTDFLDRARAALGNVPIGNNLQIKSEGWDDSYVMPQIIPAAKPKERLPNEEKLVGVFDGFHGKKRRAFFEVIGKTSSHTREVYFDEKQFRNEIELRSKSDAAKCIVTVEEIFEGSKLISTTIKSIAEDTSQLPL